MGAATAKEGSRTVRDTPIFPLQVFFLSRRLEPMAL